MLDALKRLFSRAPAGAVRPWDQIVVWAEQQRHAFRSVRDGGGFVVEGQLGAVPWRLEWGPPQRSYVSGSELRLRAELGLPASLQVMVLDRDLQASMETAVFDQYVDGVQTRIDNQTPPEMRWLVMHPKLDSKELGLLCDRFAAVGASKSWLASWLDGPLSAALLDAPLADGQALVLMIARGRMTLRTSLASPSPQVLDDWLRVFHTAMREARRAAEQAGAASTEPSLWSTGDEGAGPGR